MRRRVGEPLRVLRRERNGHLDAAWLRLQRLPWCDLSGRQQLQDIQVSARPDHGERRQLQVASVLWRQPRPLPQVQLKQHHKQRQPRLRGGVAEPELPSSLPAAPEDRHG